MNSQPFAFPPPPPAPPQASPNGDTYQHPFSISGNYGRGRGRGNHGGEDRGRGFNRGGARGRSRGGGFGPSNMSGHGGRSAIPSEDMNKAYHARGNGPNPHGYPLPVYPSVQLPQYPPNVRQEFGHSPSISSTDHMAYQSNFTPHSTNGQSNFDPQYLPYGHNSATQYPQVSPGLSQGVAHFDTNSQKTGSQPVLMGPPMRWGFDGQGKNHQAQQHIPPNANSAGLYANNIDSPYGHDTQVGFRPIHHHSPNPYPNNRGRGQKRGHGEAFGRQKNHSSMPRAAPAVPSFGGSLPLPAKPPVLQEPGRKPRKKKRKHNQLGLTPKAAEHESSEEADDDVDEESKLAAAATTSGMGVQILQFEYKGKTSTLQSSSDIAAWLEERRKRFPTKARVAEKANRKHGCDEEQRATKQSRKEMHNKKRADAKAKPDRDSGLKIKRNKTTEDPDDAAEKAKRKVEKLRKQLEREEKRIVKAKARSLRNKHELEANAHSGEQVPPVAQKETVRKRKRSDSGSSIIQHLDAALTNGIAIGAEKGDPGLGNNEEIQSELKTMPEKVHVDTNAPDQLQKATDVAPDPLTPTSQPPGPEEDFESTPRLSDGNIAREAVKLFTTEASAINQGNVDESELSTSTLASDTSSIASEDLTSSSGSSSSDSSKEDDIPEQTTSRRDGPEKVLPPKRAKPRQICRYFLKNGRCNRGDNCRYRHDLPVKGNRGVEARGNNRTAQRAKRVGLYQRLVEQEKEKENQEILREKALLEAEESKRIEAETEFRG